MKNPSRLLMEKVLSSLKGRELFVLLLLKSLDDIRIEALVLASFVGLLVKDEKTPS